MSNYNYINYNHPHNVLKKGNISGKFHKANIFFSQRRKEYGKLKDHYYLMSLGIRLNIQTYNRRS